jgi:hypothetical protein
MARAAGGSWQDARAAPLLFLREETAKIHEQSRPDRPAWRPEQMKIVDVEVGEPGPARSASATRPSA